MKKKRELFATVETYKAAAASTAEMARAIRKAKKKPKPFSWGDAYRRARRKGYDHGYAAHSADMAEERAEKTAKKESGEEMSTLSDERIREMQKMIAPFSPNGIWPEYYAALTELLELRALCRWLLSETDVSDWIDNKHASEETRERLKLMEELTRE